MNEEIKVYQGGAIKQLEDGKIGGYLVTFSDEDTPDLEGDFFTKDTDFGTATKTPIWFNHRLPMKTAKGKPITIKQQIGNGEMSVDDKGVFIEAVLWNREQYEEVLDSLGWSSGTASHLIDVEEVGKAFHIKHWPLGLDASLTPTPAEPRNRAIPLKSLIDDDSTTTTTEGISYTTTKSIPATPEDTGDVSAQKPIVISISDDKEYSEMSEEVKDATKEEAQDYATKDEFNGLSDNVKALSDSVNQILEAVTSNPKYKKVGYVAPDSETDHPEVKTFGDFLVAIQRGNVKRLSSVYRSTKDLSGEQGTAGGYLVPEEFRNELLRLSDESAGLVSRVRRVPVMTSSGSYPALDQYITPTAGSGNTAFAGGVSPATTAEGAAYGEASDPAFKMLEWRVNKVGDIVDVPNELMDDSGQSIDALLRSLFGIAINNKLEHYILRGTGAGEPEGILNAACAVAVTTAADNTFGEADALGMLARFKPAGGSPVWIMHRGVIPDFNGFTSNGSDLVEWRQGLNGSLLNYPIVYSEHSPQDDNAGDVILADLGAYLLFDRQQLTIDASEHAKFENDITVWRFKIRVDGMPWLTSAITLADPQGSYTVSPFVYHND